MTYDLGAVQTGNMEAEGPSQADEQRVKVVSVSCGSSHSIALLSESRSASTCAVS